MILSRLRKIESLTIKITEEMPIHYDYEADTLYRKGTEVLRKQTTAQKSIYDKTLDQSEPSYVSLF